MTRARVAAFGLTVAYFVAGFPAVASGGEGSGPTITPSQVEPSPHEPGLSALDDPTQDDLPKPLVDPDELRAGGPPPDGIPAIDEPRFERAGEVDWLRKREPVLAFELDGEARAYPVQILMWHEIVNDTVAGTPVAITYCPLCNSALAFDRRLGDRVLDFGTSGMLYQSDLVMYDRQTESLWVQILGRAVVGRLSGDELTPYPVSTVAWRDWRRAHPEGLVLSRDTGFDRAYGQNPYPGYDDEGGSPFLFDGPTDDRLVAMARVVGLQRGDAAVALTFKHLRKQRVAELDLDGPVVVWLVPGTASSLDDTSVAGGADVGATGAFEPVVDGRDLHFMPLREEGLFRDTETGSTWDVLGRAIDGPLVGRSLTPVVHVDTFWFAWAAFQPDTRIVR
ncbi:MAG: DUF3179 domain-containing protein [Acidimicrobiia bacterium]